MEIKFVAVMNVCNVGQFLVGFVDLVKPVSDDNDIGDYHLVVGDATHWLEALAQIHHVAVLWHSHTVSLRGFAHRHVKNLKRGKIIKI